MKRESGEDRNRPSIATAGALRVLLGTTLVVLLLGGIFTWREDSRRQETLAVQAGLAARWAGAMLAAGVPPEEAARQLLTGPPVAAVRLLDAGGKELASSGKVPAAPWRVESGLPGGGQLLLILEGQAVQRLPESLALLGVAWLAALFTGVLALRRFWQRGVQRPWAELLAAADALAAGDLEYRLPPGDWAESVRLAHAMNSLRSTCAVLVHGVQEGVGRMRSGSGILCTGLEMGAGQGEQLAGGVVELVETLEIRTAGLSSASQAAGKLQEIIRALEQQQQALAGVLAEAEEQAGNGRQQSEELIALLRKWLTEWQGTVKESTAESGGQTAWDAALVQGAQGEEMAYRLATCWLQVQRGLEEVGRVTGDLSRQAALAEKVAAEWRAQLEEMEAGEQEAAQDMQGLVEQGQAASRAMAAARGQLDRMQGNMRWLEALAGQFRGQEAPSAAIKPAGVEPVVRNATIVV